MTPLHRCGSGGWKVHVSPDVMSLVLAVTPKCRSDHAARFGLYLHELAADALWLCRKSSR